MSNGQKIGFVVVVLGEFVDSDDDPPTSVHLAFETVSGVGDLPDEVAVVDAGVHPLQHGAATDLIYVVENLVGLTLHLVGHPLHEVRAPQRVDHRGGTSLVSHDLLGAKGDASSFLGGQG